MKKIRVTASQPQHTEAGHLLGRLYYGEVLSKLLACDEYSGYPHNGGEHTLHLNLSPNDFKAFLDTVSEIFPTHPGLKDFVESAMTDAVKRNPRYKELLQ